MKVWQLRSGADRRFKAGHPWVYSNELSSSPKGIEPGEAIELRDASGAVLARGYGNPGSLIAFRALSRGAGEADPASVEGVLQRLRSAGSLRQQLGLGDVSHRLCFGEADRLPGLIVDRYLPAKPIPGSKAEQVFVVQAHTAGMDRMLPMIIEALQLYAGADWARSAIVLRNDAGARKLEGLAIEEARVAVGTVDAEALRDVAISVKAALGGAALAFRVDLIEGQKTGFFLDQGGNVALAARTFQPWAGHRPLRILDLCCYVGQWGTQLAHAFGKSSEIEVTAVDSSARALELAQANIEATGARCVPIRGDVLKDLAGLDKNSFDLVVADPPALIKGRKDIPTGTHAYLQLNTQVFRLVREGGAVVSASCSYLLEEESFASTLTKAARRGSREVRWVARGGQAPDHPILTEFPEGRYLKAWIGFA